MKYLDKNYLKIQFQLRVHEKNAMEFQRFFEDIMQSAFKDFKKIRPYGKVGDKGNDGYRPGEGIYYQVYSPEKPVEKEAEAARKIKRDFGKLKSAWDQIAKIKTYYFVYNDKWNGVGIHIEKSLAELKAENPGIEFKTFLPKDLEEIFYSLKIDSVLSLGFDVDSRDSLNVCRATLEKIDIHLDRGNGYFALESLHNCKDIILKQNDEILFAEWELLECRALELVECVEEAKQKYENLSMRFPGDPRPFLRLAEIFLNIEEFEKNNDLLKIVENIDSSDWLLKLEKILRNMRLGKVDSSIIEETDLPTDPKMRSNFYRLYAAIFLKENNIKEAERCIERALKLNPDRLSNYFVRLGILEQRILAQNLDNGALKKEMRVLSSEVESFLDRVDQWGHLGLRNQAFINFIKFRISVIYEDISESEKLAKDFLSLVTKCYFDVAIEDYLTGFLWYSHLPQDIFDDLKEYLRNSKKIISDHLSKALVIQFMMKNTLMTEGRTFFSELKKDNVVSLIKSLENDDFEQVWDFMKADSSFAVAVANTAKNNPALRRKIIENLPDDGNIQKDKLLLLLNSDENKMDEAFGILKNLDLSKLRYIECGIFLKIAREKKAWEFIIILLEKLLTYETDEQTVLQLKLELFDTNLKLKSLPKAIEIGENILSSTSQMRILKDNDKEYLLANTALSLMERGDFPKAKTLIESHSDLPKTMEFKIAIETEVFLKNKEVKKAIKSVVDGIKILRTPTPEHYSKLFFILHDIDSIEKLSLTSEHKFKNESFVKLKGQDRWYYVGDGSELDAIKIHSKDERFNSFQDKGPGDIIVFEFKYRPSIEYCIENILPIEKYIFAQAVYYFNKMAFEGNLEGVEAIEVPQKGDSIDTKNLIALFEAEKKDEFFDRYCRNNIPLACLAAIEGGLIGAIGLVQNEDKGFIRFSSGDRKELKKQLNVAERIISGELFYIDGTSALILSETALFSEICSNLPRFKVPQSVISMLLKCKEKFRYKPGQGGYLNYKKGQLAMTEIKPEQYDTLYKNFGMSTELLESRAEGMGLISAANKSESWFEQKVPEELCDACILAQKEDTLIMTEDYLYLQLNHLITQKKAPEYCSAFALIKILYDQKKITFDKYLRFYGYLASYRFRFLPVTVNDIEKAVLGDGEIAFVQPDRIRWFNFPLTLSESYGVSFATAFKVLDEFMFRILTDESIVPDLAERIFVEILSEFPKEKEKKYFGRLLLNVCAKKIKRIQDQIIIGTKIDKKIDRLYEVTRIFHDENKLWSPRN